MKAKDIRELTDSEIVARIKEEEDHLLRLKMNHSISGVESPAKITQAKKTFARLQTILNERKKTQQG